jgi:hypothetical protein
MNEEYDLEEFDHEINEDRTHAHLLIQISNPQSFEKAEKVIEKLGASVLQKTRLKSNWVLVKLDVTDVREFVLKLTEIGFSNIKGINAIQSL